MEPKGSSLAALRSCSGIAMQHHGNAAKWPRSGSAAETAVRTIGQRVSVAHRLVSTPLGDGPAPAPQPRMHESPLGRFLLAATVGGAVPQPLAHCAAGPVGAEGGPRVGADTLHGRGP